MKNIYTLLAIYSIITLINSGMQGAIFTLKYEGTKEESIWINIGYQVNHILGSGQTVQLNRGEARRIDTGPVGIRCFVSYKTLDDGFRVNVNVGAANIGGTFVFYDDGKCSYYFGIDSNWKWTDGTGTPVSLQDNPTKNEWPFNWGEYDWIKKK